MRISVLALVALVVALAGCAASPAPPDDKFPADDKAGSTFPINGTDGLLAVHLTVKEEGRVAYRVLAREGARVDTCLMPGWDAPLWWAHRTVPTLACRQGAIIAQNGATLPPGQHTLVVRATSCPASDCTISMVTTGADVAGTEVGPLVMRDVEARESERCPIC